MLEILSAPEGLTTGTDLKNWVLVIAGNVLAMFVAIKGLKILIKGDWGEGVTLFAGAILVAGFVTFPNQTIDFFSDIWKTILQ